MTGLRLLVESGRLASYTLSRGEPFPSRASGDFNRLAYAATHVVADPLKTTDPWQDAVIDWDATVEYRRYLWGLGFGVAEAMDTAQRGMGLDWPTSLELITRSIDAAADFPGAMLASGAGTDHLDSSTPATMDQIIAAYCEQCEAIERLGGRIVLMASRALAASAGSPDDYATVYGAVLGQARDPVIIHWLGEMFDPALDGYWGYGDHHAAMEVCLGILGDNAEKIDGVKVSLLDKDKEIAMRRRLPPGMRMYTGDDFNYPELIAGDGEGHSDALLGIFDAIAPAASAALSALTSDNEARFQEILAPTITLSRYLFQAPTLYYKTGVVFMAYLNGHQGHFTMVGGQQSARSIGHLCELFRLADRAGLLADPDRAAQRMKITLAVHGIDD